MTIAVVLAVIAVNVHAVAIPGDQPISGSGGYTVCWEKATHRSIIYGIVLENETSRPFVLDALTPESIRGFDLARITVSPRPGAGIGSAMLPLHGLELAMWNARKPPEGYVIPAHTRQEILLRLRLAPATEGAQLVGLTARYSEMNGLVHYVLPQSVAFSLGKPNLCAN